MKMMKKYKSICLACTLGAALCATSLNAADMTKTLKALYRNIRVTYNGTQKTLSAEPFVVDGVTYVPLRSVSEIMGASVDWNGSTNMITIQNSAGDTSSLQQQLTSANYQLATVQRELQQTKAELETYKKSNSSNNSSSNVTTGTDVTSSELSATENYLYSNYSNELDDDIDLDFDLTKKSSKLQLVVSYTTSNENKTFDELREKTITNFLQDVCDDISARHSNINIEGVINYTKSDTDKLSFSYAYKNNRLTVDYGLDEDEVVDIVEETYSKLTLPSYGTTSIKNVEATIKDSSETITFTIYIDMKASEIDTDTWNENISTGTHSLRNEFKEIRNAIESETSYDVIGELYTSDGKVLLAEYDGKDNTLDLKKIK